MENNEKKRFEYIDLARGIGIILVVIGHLPYLTYKTGVWIYSFHMPLFFMLSGITLAISASKSRTDNQDKSGNTNKTAMKKIIKKAKSLLIPYLWFSLFYILIALFNLAIGVIDKAHLIEVIVKSVTFEGYFVLWFLPAMFIAESIIILLQETKLNEHQCRLSATVIGVLSAVTVYYLSNKGIVLPYCISTIAKGLVLLPFIIEGHVFCLTLQNLNNVVSDKKISYKVKLIITIVIGAILLATFSFFAIGCDIIDINSLKLGNPLLFYVNGIGECAGLAMICFGIMGLAKEFSCTKYPIIGFPVTRLAGRKSLFIMFMHTEFYGVYFGMKLASLVYRYISNDILYTAIVVIIACAEGIIGGLLIERYLPFILGRKREKRNKKSVET